MGKQRAMVVPIRPTCNHWRGLRGLRDGVGACVGACERRGDAGGEKTQIGERYGPMIGKECREAEGSPWGSHARTRDVP